MDFSTLCALELRIVNADSYSLLFPLRLTRLPFFFFCSSACISKHNFYFYNACRIIHFSCCGWFAFSHTHCFRYESFSLFERIEIDCHKNSSTNNNSTTDTDTLCMHICICTAKTNRRQNERTKKKKQKNVSLSLLYLHFNLKWNMHLYSIQIWLKTVDFAHVWICRWIETSSEFSWLS